MIQQFLRGATLYSMYDMFANKTTTDNNWADAGILNTMLHKTTRFLFEATNNNLNVQILGSIDGGNSYGETVAANFAVNVGTPVSQSVSNAYTGLKVQVKPAANNAHGTLASKYMGMSF